MIDRRVPGPHQADRKWQCPKCGYTVWAVEQPEPCRKHRLQKMQPVDR